MQRRQGKGRHETSPLPDLGHIRPDCTARQGKANAIWVQESRFSGSSDGVCASVSSVQFGVHVSARCSICTVGSDYASLTLAPYEKFPQSRVSNMCTGPTYLPTCLSACTVNALFGYRCLRTTLFDLSALFGYERCINALFCHK